MFLKVISLDVSDRVARSEAEALAETIRQESGPGVCYPGIE